MISFNLFDFRIFSGLVIPNAFDLFTLKNLVMKAWFTFLFFCFFTISGLQAQWAQLGQDLDGDHGGDSFGRSCSLNADGTVLAVGAPEGLNDAGYVRVFSYLSGFWQAMGDVLEGGGGDVFLGRSVALNADGTVLAVGVPGGYVDGVGASGYVRVYAYEDNTWQAMGLIGAGEHENDFSGGSIALDASGSVLAVGMPGVDGSTEDEGEVRVYVYENDEWVQRGQSLSGVAFEGAFGWSVSLSADGMMLAVGEIHSSLSGPYSGAVYVYQYDLSSSSWELLGAPVSSIGSTLLGYSLSLSADGLVLAAGAPGSTGSEGNSSGRVEVFAYEGGSWVAQGQAIEGEAAGDLLGYSLDLSADGTLLAVSAKRHDGNGEDAGYVRLFRYENGAWEPFGDPIEGEWLYDESGESVSLSADGMIVAIGALGNDGGGLESGQVRVFEGSCVLQDIDVSLQLEGAEMTVAESGAGYQWIDCTSGEPIAGATAQTYTATATGTYAVVVTQGMCSRTSDCVQIIVADADEPERFKTVLYPNPVEDVLNLQLDRSVSGMAVRVIDGRGRSVYFNPAFSGERLQIAVDDWPSGLYVLELSWGSDSHFLQFAVLRGR